MANILGGGCINGFLSDIGGVLADAFEKARNKNEIEIAPQLIRINCGAISISFLFRAFSNASASTPPISLRKPFMQPPPKIFAISQSPLRCELQCLIGHDRVGV